LAPNFNGGLAYFIRNPQTKFRDNDAFELFVNRKVNPANKRLEVPFSTQQTRIDNMADRGGAAPRGGAGFGSRGGDRGGDRGRGDRGRGRRGPRRGANKNEEKEWQPVTKLGRLVKAGKIKSMEEIYLHSLPIKEYQIVDFFLPKLKDEVMKVRSHCEICNIWRNCD
jgi:hypothetical protein